MTEWVLVIFLTTGGWWHGNGETFDTKKACVDYLHEYKRNARTDNVTVGGYCESTIKT